MYASRGTLSLFHWARTLRVWDKSETNIDFVANDAHRRRGDPFRCKCLEDSQTIGEKAGEPSWLPEQAHLILLRDHSLPEREPHVVETGRPPLTNSLRRSKRV